MSSVSSCSTALTIFHRNTLVRRLTQNLHGMDIDSWIWLARRLWEARRCGKHMVGIEEAVLVDFLDRSLDATESRGGDDGEVVFFVFVEFL